MQTDANVNGRQAVIPQGAPFNAHTMTKTYAQIVKQIEVLKQDAERVRRKEVDGVIGRIRDAISVYSLSAQDLGFGSGKSSTAASQPAATPAKRKTRGTGKAGKAAKSPKIIKFANGSGGTWGGLGKRPQWLRDALAEGKALADFLVK